MPKIVDRREKRNQILQAALNVFSSKGFDNSKMADIARQAGIGKGTIYEYFKSKKEVFSELFLFLFRDFDREFERRLTGVSDPVEKLRLIVRIYFVDFIEQYGDFVKIVIEFWTAEIRSENNWQVQDLNLAAIYDHYTRLIAEVIEDGVRQKRFRPVDARRYAAMLLGLFDGMYLQLFLNVNRTSPEDMAQSILELFLNALTNTKK